MNAGFQWFVPDLAASNLGMSDRLEYKRAATQAVHSLGLQSDLRARAVVLVAAHNKVGNELRTLKSCAAMCLMPELPCHCSPCSLK